MQYDFAVIGSSIVGLATALRLLARRPSSLLMIESEVIAHQRRYKGSVMHAGTSYRPGSLKARLCRAGLDAIRAFYTKPGIPYVQYGKPIVAINALEQQRYHPLYQRASANGLSLKKLNARFGGFWTLVSTNREHPAQDLYGPLWRHSYLGACRQCCPKPTLIDLLPYHAGIRAQVITAQGEPIQGFLYLKAGRPLHNCKAPSPVASLVLATGQMKALQCISARPAGD